MLYPVREAKVKRLSSKSLRTKISEITLFINIQRKSI